MKNLVSDGVRTAGVLGVVMGMVVACGGANTTPVSDPAKTTAAPAGSGAAPAGSAAAGGGAKEGGKEQINTLLKDHSRELKACYDREKDRGMAYKGDTKFHVKVDSAGKATDVQGVNVPPPAEFLSSCVSDSMKGWTFPHSSKGGDLTFTVPW